MKIGWFSTGRGPGSRRLFAAVQEEIASGRLPVEIAVVFCNRERGEDPNTDEFLDLVRGCELPLVCLSSREFRRRRGGKPAKKGAPLPEWRREYDREAMRLLEPYRFELGVLAGYMLIFCQEAARRWDLLNLHPAPPGGPKGVWQDVIWHLIESGAEQAGVMMHLATPDLDEGPPVTYGTYSIRGPAFDELWETIADRDVTEVNEREGEANPLFAEIRRHGLAHEVPLVIETLRAFATERIAIRDKAVFDADGRPVGPQDLTQEIRRSVAASLA